MIGTLPAGQARAVLLNCEKSPAYVPFKLLRMVQRHAKGNLNASQVAPAARGVVPWLAELDFDYVLYDEADQTLHFEGTALRDVFDVLTQHPDYYAAPAALREGVGGIRAICSSGETCHGRRTGANPICRGWRACKILGHLSPCHRDSETRRGLTKGG